VPRVCVIGSANVDYTMALPRLPQPGETVLGGTLLVNMGGKGANQALAARRLGAEVELIGCVGDDAAGADARERLAAAGIEVGGLRAVAGVATGTALILVDETGRNEIAVASGANHRLTVAMVEAHADAIARADVVVCQLETPVEVVRWALAAARRHGVTTILNPAPVADLPEALYRDVDFLTPNETEASALSGLQVADAESARAAAQRLVERGARTVVVTLGDQIGRASCRERV